MEEQPNRQLAGLRHIRHVDQTVDGQIALPRMNKGEIIKK
jgi:hypothetical protein